MFACKDILFTLLSQNLQLTLIPMQYKIAFSLFLSLFVLISCNKDHDLSFDISQKSAKDFGCETDCPDISIQQLEALGHSEEMKPIADNINKNLSEHIIYSLSTYEDSTEEIESVEEAVKQFISDYHEDKMEFPDMLAHYKATIKSEKLHDSENMLSIRMFTHLYTGGAHGYSSVSYLNLDPKTGHIIPLEQMLIDIEDFIGFVEMKFREAYDIPKTSDINATRFMFDGNVFILPSSMGFDEKHMLFTYNPYEIAPYAEGPIELKIPINEVQAFLNTSLE